MKDLAPHVAEQRVLLRDNPQHETRDVTPKERTSRVLSHMLVTVVAIFAITFALRAYQLNRSFDIFVDEITYVHVAQAIAWHLKVTIYGQPFFLHPPAFLFIEGGVLRVIHPGGPEFHTIFFVRYINLVFASLSAVALFLIVQRLAGWIAGVIAALAFALDPFVISMNSQNLLDTSAVTWILIGYAVLLGVDGDTLQLSPFRAVAAGVAFGLGLLTKDMTFFLSLLPLFGCWLLRFGLRRRTSVVVAGVTVLVYLPYPIIAAAVGQWQNFVDAKTHGVARLAGIIQMTGFNRPGSPSLLHSIIERLTIYGTTYAIIGFGVLGAFFLYRRGRPADRLVSMWVGSAYALLAYCVLIGTLEQQFFYFLVVPALVATVAGADALLGAPIARVHLHHSLRVSCSLLALLFAGWSASRWIIVHSTPNNGYQLLLDYMHNHIPYQGRHIASLDQTGQFLLGHRASGPFGSWYTISAVRRYQPDYVVITPREIDWDYGTKALPLEHWVVTHGERVFVFHGQGDSDILLYWMHWSPPDHAPVASIEQANSR